MRRFLFRIGVVVLCGLIALIGLEAVLMRDEPRVHYTLDVEGVDAGGKPVTLTLKTDYSRGFTRDDEAVPLSDALADLQTLGGRLTLRGDSPDRSRPLRAELIDGAARLNGAPVSTAELHREIRDRMLLTPTRAVTVADVLAAKIPTPTLSRVSFPAFSYADAFGLAAAEKADDVLVIPHFRQAPMLDDLDAMPAAWREHYPASLPPVAERLPRNPAVIRGPDGVGEYGGLWRRATVAVNDLRRKIGYESFIRFDPSGKIQPCLAYKWDVADHNRVFTFYLRKGHRWSDGRPFTTEDILWVCNTLIGSGYQASRPNWMQETDSTARLFDEDIRSWPHLAAAILRQAQSTDPSPGRQLAAAGGENLLALLRTVPEDGPPDKAARYEIVAHLNAAFRDRRFYDAAAFSRLDLRSELESLETIGYSRLSKRQAGRMIFLLEATDLAAKAAANVDAVETLAYSRLCLFLFRKAYSDCVDPGRKKFVAVEAVPDADGDASHIIRFTFPKPNAIFLEKTATFMFYLGLFGTPKHFTAPLHPAGSTVLNTVDIYDWPAWSRRLCAEGVSRQPSPGRQIWLRLDPEVRLALVEDPPTDETPEARKQDIIDAVNAAMASLDFYSDAAWRSVDLDSEWRELTADGFSGRDKSRAWRDRIRQLLDRADLLRRLRSEGAESLTDEERFRLHLALFRAAYDRTAEPDRPLLAFNREDALNTAAQNHPRKYSTWTSRLWNINTYDPVTNPHLPTLRAWRMVSPPTDQAAVALRNPYYYKVDTEGRQLPYIDAVETFKESRKSNILLKMASGNVDFQVREIAFEDYTYLKSHERQGDYELRLWANDYCGEVWFAPLQPHKDPLYRKLQDDPRFRHALSLALNRREIIDTVYGGVGEPAQYAVPAGSPYYSAKQATMSIAYDPAKANELLDAMGLDRRNRQGVRLLSDGRPLIMNVDTQAERPLAVVQMACSYWREIGVDARMHVRSWNALSRMSQIGILDIRVHKEGGNFFGPIMAGGYAPTHPAEAVQWWNWASYIRSGGRTGWEPPARIMEIQRMWEDVITAPDDQAKYAAWRTLADRTADDLPIIGVMTSPGKLVYVKNNFKNVPKIAFAGWIAHDPGNCCPEAFFFDPAP